MSKFKSELDVLIPLMSTSPLGETIGTWSNSIESSSEMMIWPRVDSRAALPLLAGVVPTSFFSNLPALTAAMVESSSSTRSV